MTRERYLAYLDTLEHIDRIDRDRVGDEALDRMRELVQDVFLCRDEREVDFLLEQIATEATSMTTTGGLGREASVDLWSAAIACGPEGADLGTVDTPSLVA